MFKQGMSGNTFKTFYPTPESDPGNYTGHGFELVGPMRDVIRLPIAANALGWNLHTFDFRAIDNPNQGGSVGLMRPMDATSGGGAGGSTPPAASSPLLGFSEAQWSALVQAVTSSLSNERQKSKSGNITAPTLDVFERIYGSILNTGLFTTDQMTQIWSAMQGAMAASSGGQQHLNAPASGIAANVLQALAAFNPANVPPPPPTSGGGTGVTDPTLGSLVGALTTPPTPPDMPQSQLYAQPTGGGASSMGLPLILILAGGGVIYWWWRRHHGPDAPKPKAE